MDIFPMNAKAAKDKFEALMADDNYIGQQKIDGVRALIHIGVSGSVRVTTRGASVDAPDIPIDITHRIPCLVGWSPYYELRGSIFDTELVIRGLDSAQIAGIVNYKSTVAIPEGMILYVFDVLRVGIQEIMGLPQRKRIAELDKLAPWLPDFIKPLPVFLGTEKKYKALDKILSVGGEGLMLKNLNAIYYPDKRPSNVWYKVKKVDSTDAKIVGAAPPEQFYRDPETGKVDENRVTKPWAHGWFGALVYELEDGTQGTVSGFSDEERTIMGDGDYGIKPEYLGRVMELKFMEKTKDKKLRHPRFIRLREEVEKK